MKDYDHCVCKTRNNKTLKTFTFTFKNLPLFMPGLVKRNYDHGIIVLFSRTLSITFHLFQPKEVMPVMMGE